MVSESRRRGLVLGCGGTLGAAWMIAALHEIERCLQWDARTASVIIGTSSGAEIASLLGTGVSVRSILDAALGRATADAALVRHFENAPAPFPPRPTAKAMAPALALRGLGGKVRPLTALSSLLPIGRGDASHLDTLVDARALTDAWATHPAVYLVAVDLVSGERVAFGKTRGVGSYAIRPALRDALRASWAIPGWYPPVVIDGRPWIDGGVASPTSADLLADADLDEIVVVAPMASCDEGERRGLGKIEQVLRRAMTRRLDAEARDLSRAGIAVLRVEPGPDDLAVMGPNFMDRSRRLAVLESSLRTTRGRMGGWS